MIYQRGPMIAIGDRSLSAHGGKMRPYRLPVVC